MTTTSKPGDYELIEMFIKVLVESGYRQWGEDFLTPREIASNLTTELRGLMRSRPPGETFGWFYGKVHDTPEPS